MLRAQTEFAAYPRVATKFVYCCFLAFFAFQADENASAILRLWNEFPIGVAVLTLAGISVQNEDCAWSKFGRSFSLYARVRVINSANPLATSAMLTPAT